MAMQKYCFLLVLLLGAYSWYPVSARLRGSGGGLEPPERKSVLETDGGKIEVWSEDFQMFKDMEIGAALITLEEKGLALPKYANADHILYVLEGCARVELYYPWGYPTNIRTVKQGDVVVIPRGWVSWWYNDGKEKARIFGVADTSAGTEPGRYQSFFLAGASKKEFGGILHGFSKDVLSRAWDVSEDTVDKLLQSQSDAGIIKVKEGVSLPQTETSKTCRGGPCIGDFRYNIDDMEPDFTVKDGGYLHLLNCYKLPVLKKVGFGVIRVLLKPGAMVAPNWSPNAHGIGIVTRGKGRVQVTSPDGENALDMDLQEGQLFVIPRFFASVQIAEKDSPLEYVMITTVSNPTTTFLAGMGNIYNTWPGDIRRAAFNIDKDLEAKLLESGHRHAAILPPTGQKLAMPSDASDSYRKWIGQSNKWIDEAKELLDEVFA